MKTIFVTALALGMALAGSASAKTIQGCEVKKADGGSANYYVRVDPGCTFSFGQTDGDAAEADKNVVERAAFDSTPPRRT